MQKYDILVIFIKERRKLMDRTLESTFQFTKQQRLSIRVFYILVGKYFDRNIVVPWGARW